MTSERAEIRLKRVGLRLTKQRIALAELLFGPGDRHVTAESFYDEALAGGLAVSLATIYNTLHQFTQAGLLKQVVVDSSKTYFDTNTDDHHHFFLEDVGELLDIPSDQVEVSKLPLAPSGTSIDRVDVIVRVRSDQDA